MAASEKLQAQMLADPETFGSALLVIALNKYKEQVFEVDPMTLIMDLEDDFRVKMPESGENRLKAILLATETQLFQQDPEAFRGTCVTLWYGDPQIDSEEGLTLAEAIWGMFEVKCCHGAELALSPGIQHLIDSAADQEAGDLDTQEDAYSHAREAVQAQYTRWVDQMTGLGANPQDIPSLEG